MHGHKKAIPAGSLALVLALAAHAGPASPKPAKPQQVQRILIRDFMYQPMSVTIRAGTTVTWINKDEEPHTIISTSGLFRSGGIDTDETFAYRFDKPGRYDVYCSVHPRMVATIIVE